MRNYGKIEIDVHKNEWVITADRHIMARLKRVFEGISKFPKKQVTVSNTPEHCLDLLWFMKRYPLEILSGEEEMRLSAAAYTSMVERLDDIADPNYVPTVHPLAIPLRGYQNVAVKNGSGQWGWQDNAPYDAILVTAGISGDVPKPLLDQLKENGVLVAPVGRGHDKQMVRLVKKKNRFKKEKFGIFTFVPFVEEEN